ncbi:DNA replication/repair protein RecF [Salinicola halophilus]|uniref:DNA replication/repair protein RecF n=1 Tax=Salinicola halophilus TaxID=184065 RepID=UPI000DA1C0F7|nr:DNA replication/repair protein RecF [Salinicola halophilus]
MPLDRLSFQGLRNLEPFEMTPGPHINLISGANGSGKTSLLEGIHLLGMARSFRTQKLKSVIGHDEEAFTLFGRLAGDPPVPLGVRRRRDTPELEIRVGGERAARITQLAEALPLQLINPDAFRLLEGSPAARREFLDWGVFHGESAFLDVWKRTRRALKHRNALLRHDRIDVQSIRVWEQELAHWSERLDALRETYMARFLPVFEETLAALLPLPDLALRYSRGWDGKRELLDIFEGNRDTDRQMGFTQQGPQRADLRIRLGRHPAVEVLSRGQQKLVVSALKLAQGRLLEQWNARTCLYLIDDLPAELDGEHRQIFCRWLETLDCQVFITSVDHSALADVWQPGTDVATSRISRGRLHPE